MGEVSMNLELVSLMPKSYPYALLRLYLSHVPFSLTSLSLANTPSLASSPTPSRRLCLSSFEAALSHRLKRCHCVTLLLRVPRPKVVADRNFGLPGHRPSKRSCARVRQ